MNRYILLVMPLFLLVVIYPLAAEEVAVQREALSPRNPLSAPATAIQASASTPQHGMMMCCPMMGMMGGGMMSGMSHNMSHGLGMKDIMQIMTMLDTLQILTDMLKIQEQIIERAKVADSSRLKRDIEDLRERAKQAIIDLKNFVAEQPR